MQEQIIQFFKDIPIPDYVIILVSLWFFVMFIFTGIEKIYKAYLWVILWLFIFTTVNLTLNSLNSSDVWVNGLRDFFFNHKEGIWFWSVFFIPLLGILLPLNKNIWFRISKNKWLNYLVIFLFGIFFFTFIVSIFLSIINNKFLFTMDNEIITEVSESSFIKFLYWYFSPSHIFNFLLKYDYVINLCVIIFIFYKMTIGWIVDFLFAKLFQALGKMFEKKAKEEGGWHEAH